MKYKINFPVLCWLFEVEQAELSNKKNGFIIIIRTWHYHISGRFFNTECSRENFAAYVSVWKRKRRKIWALLLYLFVARLELRVVCVFIVRWTYFRVFAVEASMQEPVQFRFLFYCLFMLLKFGILCDYGIDFHKLLLLSIGNWIISLISHFVALNSE